VTSAAGLLSVSPKDAAALAVVEKSLRSEDERIRLQAVELLPNGIYPVSDCISKLTESLHDENVDVRLAAVAGLGRFGKSAKPAVPALINASDSIGIIPVVRTMARIDPDDKIVVQRLKSLEPFFARELASPSREQKLLAIEMLGYLCAHSREARNCLEQALESGDIEIRKAASAALGFSSGRDKASGINSH
jgi:HEAT repeat protein